MRVGSRASLTTSLRVVSFCRLDLGLLCLRLIRAVSSVMARLIALKANNLLLRGRPLFLVSVILLAVV